MTRLRALGLLTMVLLSACQQAVSAPGGPTADPSTAAALQLWANFPVHASVRPVVLVGPAVAGTDLDPDFLRLAYIDGWVDGPARLPVGPAAASGYPLITAEAAIDRLKAEPPHNPFVTSGNHPRFAITTITLDRAAFRTDRGSQSLPAWRFSPGTLGPYHPVWVLAIDRPALWMAAPKPTDSLTDVAMTADHRTIVAHFTGWAPGSGPCTASYQLQLTETLAAVAVKVIEQFHYPMNKQVACATVGNLRSASATLHSPLGNRVLVDASNGAAIAVTVGS